MSSSQRNTVLFVAVIVLLALAVSPATAGTSLSVDVSGLPLVFIQNEGQVSDDVLYHANAPAHSILFTKDAVVFTVGSGGISPASVEIALEGHSPGVVVTGEDKLGGKANFFIGNDPSKWVRDVPTFGRVRYSNILPGVDIVYSGTQGVLKRDIVLSPGADPSALLFRYSGQDDLALDADGNLLVKSSAGTIREAAPVCYQERNGERVPVSCRYVLSGNGLVGFDTGAYDPALPLVIDPYLDFSTYLGGSMDDRGYAVAVDSLGGTYVTGSTQSIDFPYPSWKAQYQEDPGGGLDAFVTKFEPDGLSMNYSTYLGGYYDDIGHGIAVNDSGYAFVTGETISPDFPVLKAFQENISYSGTCCSSADAFITVLTPEGYDLEFSSYLGGNMTDIGQAIALTSSGVAVIAGSTASDNFNTTAGAYDTTLNGAWDAFVTGVSYDGSVSSIAFSTYLGGRNIDRANGIALGANGDIFVTGLTKSSDFPTLNAYRSSLSGGQDAFVTHFNPPLMSC